MKHRGLIWLFVFFIIGFAGSRSWADNNGHHGGSQFPENATFTTLITTDLAIEGLTGDNNGNLYTTGRSGSPFCPVWRINLAAPSLIPVGQVAAPCSPSGIAFNKAGDLFVADGNNVLTFSPNDAAPPTAVVYASGVPGANGLAFDRFGNLWTGDGTTGQGRVWEIAPCATLPCTAVEMFRVQPMANEVNLVSGVGGVGRDARTLPPGAITVTLTSRNAQNTAGSQPLVANGVAFDSKGTLYVADTARGAIWQVEFDKKGNMKPGQTGCDTTFSPNTLCLDSVLVAHPYLEGTDGIALDREGNIWNSANERNAIVVIGEKERVEEIFRNPLNATTNLRNAATDPADNDRILETPTSPFLIGNTFCTANSDGNRRDNFPATSTVAGVNVGEIGGLGQPKGKISCLDQQLKIPGLPLPVH